MNLGEIKTAVKRFGFDDTDPLLTWINAGIQDVFSYQQWSWSEYYTAFDAAPDQHEYDYDKFARYQDVIAAKVRGGIHPLQRLGTSAFMDSVAGNEDQTGQPEYYRAWRLPDGTLVIDLWPVPDAVYTIDLRVKRAALEFDAGASDDSIPDMPRSVHYAVVLRAAGHGLLAENNEDRAGAMFDKADDRLSREGGLTKVTQVRDAQGYGDAS